MSVEKIKTYLQEYSYLKSIQSLLHWDMETMMPAGAINDRAKRLAYIQGKLHAHITSPHYNKLLSETEKMKLKVLEKRLIKELRWDFDIQNLLPEKHVAELSHVQTMATHTWAKARSENDWKTFRPHLQKLINLKRRETGFYETKKPYDGLIQLHDKEFNSDDIARLFGDLKKGLSKLMKKVKNDKSFVTVKDLKGPFPINQQINLSKFVTNLFGLSHDFSRLDTSTHPFSINISPRDQRITTRYVEENIDSLFSTMHEVGHALYELNLPQEWEGTPFQEAISLSVHESQSRFWENIIGRSREFTNFIHPHMTKYFPKNMKGVSEDKLFLIFNRSIPGLIRVESPELYYNFHVIIRYEIEEMIFNHGLNAADLPQIWNEKYKDYLGISPSNDREGILQDSHWAGGAFGYFPTYTLGNLISGSLYYKMKKEVPAYKKNITNGDFRKIGQFLQKNIHKKGRSVSSHDIIGEIKVNDYLSYLKDKFGV